MLARQLLAALVKQTSWSQAVLLKVTPRKLLWPEPSLVSIELDCFSPF